jgi:hypothetical protein
MCPFCNQKYLYDPSDYHKKIKCNNAGCIREFGFYIYHVSDRRDKELRLEIREGQEKRAKTAAGKEGRASRANRRTVPQDDKETEQAFLIGLVDACPRCGAYVSEDGAAEHLKQCTDKEMHKEHQARLTKVAKAGDKRKAKEAKQEDVQTYTAWEFLGASTESLWTLNIEHLRSECRKAELSTDGSKTDLIGRLSASRGSNRLTDARGEMPASHVLWAMSTEALLGLCAAHGIEVPADAAKSDVIEAIEDGRMAEPTLTITSKGDAVPLMLSVEEGLFEDEEDVPLIKKRKKAAPAAKKKAPPKKKAKKRKDSEEEDESEEEEDAWEP